MKHIKLILVIFALLSFAGCKDTFNLDINDNPNAVSPEQADVNFLFNSIQLDFELFVYRTWFTTSQMSRELAFTSSRTYEDAFQPTTFDRLWRRAYAHILPDVKALVEKAAKDNLSVPLQVGASKIIESYVLTTLVDMFGDVPFSEIGQGTKVIAPKADDGKSVYAAAEKLLDEAIKDLTTGTPDPNVQDLYYGGDIGKWVALANALKIRIYNNTRLVDSDAGAKIKAIVDNGGLENFDDFAFKYGVNRTAPDARHRLYANSYESSDGDYQSNYFMWLMLYEKDSIEDPRLRFYFYRQDRDLTDEDPTIWECVLTETPFDPIPVGQFDHYLAVDPRLPFCIASKDGWFGRDHGNGEGIPPDGPIRTVYGVYPAGGAFDNNSAKETQQEGKFGAKGEGIEPILMASWVDFMRAEAALMAGSGEDAKALLMSGVSKSLKKVQDFSLGIMPQSELDYVVASKPKVVTAKEAFIDNLDVKDSIYMAKVSELYDNSSDKLDVIMKEYLIAVFGNGVEGYNLYRRTGKPNNIPPVIDPAIAKTTKFPRSFLYPSVYVNLNQNATQKADQSVPVFWDNNPDGLLR